MLLTLDVIVPFPRRLVFCTYRDELTQLVEFMPTVQRVEIRSREHDGSAVKLVNVWHGGAEIPAAARVVMSKSLLSWTDYATWNESDFTCDWCIESHSFKDAVDCRGSNRFVEMEDGTRIEIRGDILIDVSKIRGVPKVLGKSLGKSVSDLLIKRITPNLIETAEGLKRYLERKQKM